MRTITKSLRNNWIDNICTLNDVCTVNDLTGFLLKSTTPSSSVLSAACDFPPSPPQKWSSRFLFFSLSALHTPEYVTCESLQVESAPRCLCPSDRSDTQPLGSVVSAGVADNRWSTWPEGASTCVFPPRPASVLAVCCGSTRWNPLWCPVHCRMSLLQEINSGIIHTDIKLQVVCSWWKHWLKSRTLCGFSSALPSPHYLPKLVISVILCLISEPFHFQFFLL